METVGVTPHGIDIHIHTNKIHLNILVYFFTSCESEYIIKNDAIYGGGFSDKN